MQLTRRHFVALGAMAVLGAGAALAVAGGGVDVLEWGSGDGGDTDGVGSALRIGRAWLRAHPEEADSGALERLLAPLPEGSRSAVPLREADVRAWLRRRQRDDFAAGRVVTLRGWWLSETEVRFCALLALG